MKADILRDKTIELNEVKDRLAEFPSAGLCEKANSLMTKASLAAEQASDFAYLAWLEQMKWEQNSS